MQNLKKRKFRANHRHASLFFVAYVEDHATLSSIRYFENHVSLFCATWPKEVDPIKLISLQQIKYFSRTQIYNKQQRIKMNKIKASMILILYFFFSLKKCITALSFLLAQWYTNLLSPDRVHPQISSSLRLLVRTCLSYISLIIFS